MKKRKTIVAIICVVAVVLLAAPFSYAWFADTLRQDTQIESYVHKSYFESGDGTSAAQFIDGLHATEEGCAFEIKYPVQLYYFAWLQALGYFNSTENGAAKQVYFYLSDDLDMTGWILPQVGTQEYPFIGNFNGNGHTISNLTVQNMEGSGANAWTDKPEDIGGLNIVGFFGVVGGLGSTSDSTHTYALPDSVGAANNYTYANAVNEVKNFVLEDATIKTDLTNSLAGIAAGYVNGTMENVKVVGGTLHSTATTALSYTANLSDFGAVGYCTEAYKDTNEIVTVMVYDPQVYTNADGSALGQGNNWGESVEMQTMYQDLLNVYNGYTSPINGTPAGKNVITVTKTDGEVTGITVTGNGEPVMTTYAGGSTYNLKVVEKKDGTDTVSFFSLVERNANFMYLYGGKTYITETVQEDAFYIHTGEAAPAHYLTLNAQLAIADSASQSTDAKWIIKDGKIYTVRSKTIIDPDAQGGSYTEDWLYYLIKNGSNQLEIVEVSQLESVPASVTDSVWTVGEDTITTGGYALVYKNGSWQLEQASTYITDNAGENFLSLNNTPAIVNRTSSATATTWSKETSGTGFKLAATVNSTKYYLNCSNSGALSVGTNAGTATVWYEDTAVENKYKVYMLTGEAGGYALYYDGSRWGATGYYVNAAGSDWGGSIDFQTLNTHLKAAYGSSGATAAVYNYSNNDMTLAMTRSNVNNPNTTSVIYRYRSGTAIPINMNDSYEALSSNTGYIVGSNIGTAANGSPKSSSYNIDYICNSLSNASVSYANVYNGTQAKYNSSTLEVLTYYSGAWRRITDSYNSAHSSVNATLSSYTPMTVADLGFVMYNSARNNLDAILKQENGTSENFIHGIHFDTNTPSSSSVTSETVSILGNTYQNYPLVNSSLNFQVKDAGKITFFAGTYYAMTSLSMARDYFDKNKTMSGYPNRDNYFNDSFFSLSKVERNPNTYAITSLKTISKIYKDTSLPSTAENPYVYAYKGETDSYSSNSRYSLEFDMAIMDEKAPVNLALYYFEIPVNPGEYTMGAVSSSQTRGAYMIYLDISANAAIEGDSKIVESISAETKHSDAGTLEYTDVEPTETDAPTYFPLAWERYGEGNSHDYRGDLPAATNTGYVISGANTVSNPPGDIRVSQYTKYATGNWASIRNSLTSTNNAGILNDAAVYTIIDGAQTNIAAYGIGKLHTMQYGSVSKTMNGLLQGNQYVYGLHFMRAQISKDNTVTVPKAVINGVTKTNYVMPQDSIDFHVATKGRIAFLAGTYFSGSNGVQSFFSLHRIFRDGSGNIADIKQLSEIYSDGDASHGYVYRYRDDANYYNADGSLNGASVPSGYIKVYDLRAIDDPTSFSGINALTQNSVYYFEIPVDAGEYALGSSDTDGAYLIYLDIAANADFAVQTTVTEVTVKEESVNYFPKGVAFVDAADSTAFDDGEDKADPAKSVFLSVPMANSGGDTAFSITSGAAMTVTNTTSSLAGYTPQTIPQNGSLAVNGVPAERTIVRRIVIEKVTVVSLDLGGTTTTTVTVTTQTTVGVGPPVTTVEQTVTTEFGGSSNTVTTTPSPVYDGHTLIPDDFTSQTEPRAKADIILAFGYTASGVDAAVNRSGELNTAETAYTVTFDDDVFTVYDVIKDSEADPVIYAAVYTVTFSGTAGTCEVSIITADDDFVFNLGGSPVETGDVVTVTVSPSS